MCDECWKHQDVRGFGKRCLLCQWMQANLPTIHILQPFSCRLKRCYDSISQQMRLLWSHQFAESLSHESGCLAGSHLDSVSPSSGSEGHQREDSESIRKEVVRIGVNGRIEESSIWSHRSPSACLIQDRVQEARSPSGRNI